jgi:hypothetical protein
MAAGPSATGSAWAVGATFKPVGWPRAKLPNQQIATYTAPPKGKTETTKKNFSTALGFGPDYWLTTKAMTVTDTAEGYIVSGATTVKSTATVSSPRVTFVGHEKMILTATASQIASSAAVSRTNTGTPKIKASVIITGLTLSSALLGIHIKNLTVSPKANQVLAKNANGTVEIIANYQIPIKTAGKVTGMVVNALDIHLQNFSYQSDKLSGDIAIANTAVK